MMVITAVDTLISVEEYLRTSFHPDRHFIDGQVVQRNVGQTKHSYAQTETAVWFAQRRETLRLQPLTGLRVRVAPPRVRVPDIVIAEIPIPREDVFTSPPYLCIEIMSPDDTKGSTQPSSQRLSEFRRAKHLGHRPLEALRMDGNCKRMGAHERRDDAHPRWPCSDAAQ